MVPWITLNESNSVEDDDLYAEEEIEQALEEPDFRHEILTDE